MLNLLPSLDAGKSGVAAYGLELARHLPGGVEGVSFLVNAPPVDLPPDVPRRAVAVVPQSAAALSAHLDAHGGTDLLLHYVGYGYARDGCPRWLLDGLRIWRQKHGRRLGVIFHELATDEPWWTRTYWTQPQQYRIVAGIARLADGVATSCPDFVRQLTTKYGLPVGSVARVPVPTTLGTIARTGRRFPAASGLTVLVFGLPATRERAFRVHAKLLRRLSRVGLLSRVIVAGADARPAEFRLTDPRTTIVEARPNVDSDELAAIGAESDIGIVWNWASILTKSTVFANLCAIGVPVVMQEEHDDAGIGLPVSPVAIGCDGSSDGIDNAIAQIRDRELLARIRDNMIEMARTQLSWPCAAENLRRCFHW